jgi:molecular chaperone DnaK (HSP70)
MGTGNTATSKSDETLIIALDFGTTFSGIAFCFANQKHPRVAVVVDWPGTDGELVPKIPTVINYDPNSKGMVSWGATASHMSDSIVGIKLLLDPSQEQPLYLPRGTIKRDSKNLPKSPVDVAADFIGAMYEHALKEIAKEVPKDYLAICRKDFILSGKKYLVMN